MRFLIGMDDTDNSRTSSTGVLAQHLGQALQDASLGKMESITRHQLFLNTQISYTSDNSSICLTIEADSHKRSEIEMFCRSFILREFASGANAGFAIAAWPQVTVEVFTWARTAKTYVVTRQEAIQMARSAQIGITGLTGTGNGVIGALAAIGLRFRGEDGRFIWLPNISLINNGVYSSSELMGYSPFDRIENLRGRAPHPDDKIEVGKWIRPVLKEGRCVLLVEEKRNDPKASWQLLGMDEVKNLSD
jgi:hypothetical protein